LWLLGYGVICMLFRNVRDGVGDLSGGGNGDLGRPPVKVLFGSSTTAEYPRVRSNLNALSKRLFDILFSSVAIITLLPVMAVIAILIKLESRGPILFKQLRNGLNNEEIEVWKFRSMSVMENGQTVKQVTKNDPRVTAVGGILRKYSLDELPQFFNVLAGSMSIVGPRPHAVSHNREFSGLVSNYSKRHTVKPGITGWAQINGARGETDTIDKMALRVKYDIVYINNWSFNLDLKIVLLTVLQVMNSGDVY